MPLKDRFRRALNRSSTTTRSNSSASSTITPPSTSPIDTTPSITLTKTSTRLSKRLTWRTEKSAEKKQQERQERMNTWEAWDRKTPIPDKKKGPHQDILRAFEWKWRSSLDGGRRSLSIWSGSGVSPGCSRVGSRDEGERVGRLSSVGRRSMTKRRSSANSAHVAQGVRAEGEIVVEPVPEE